jgi:ribosomal protein L7/L12
MDYEMLHARLASRYGLDSDEVRQFLTDANSFNCEFAALGKIQAIKEFRKATSFGLKDAKDAVEAIMVMARDSNQDSDVRGFEQRIASLNNLIEAQKAEVHALRSRIDTLHQRLNSIIEYVDADTLRAIVRDLI